MELMGYLGTVGRKWIWNQQNWNGVKHRDKDGTAYCSRSLRRLINRIGIEHLYEALTRVTWKQRLFYWIKDFHYLWNASLSATVTGRSWRWTNLTQHRLLFGFLSPVYQSSHLHSRYVYLYARDETAGNAPFPFRLSIYHFFRIHASRWLRLWLSTAFSSTWMVFACSRKMWHPFWLLSNIWCWNTFNYPDSIIVSRKNKFIPTEDIPNGYSL